MCALLKFPLFRITYPVSHWSESRARSQPQSTFFSPIMVQSLRMPDKTNHIYFFVYSALLSDAEMVQQQANLCSADILKICVFPSHPWPLPLPLRNKYTITITAVPGVFLFDKCRTSKNVVREQSTPLLPPSNSSCLKIVLLSLGRHRQYE